jgi:hypothetical protein
MNTIVTNDTNWMVPGGWNELTGKQVTRLCGLLQRGGRHLHLRVLFLLMGVGGFWRRKLRRVPNEHLVYLSMDSEVTGWVYEPANITAYPIRKIKCGWRTYYGPHENILNIPIAEWVETAIYFTGYIEKLKVKSEELKVISEKLEVRGEKLENEVLLDKLIAVLYRPSRLFYTLERFGAKFNIDRRNANNEYRFNQRVKRVAKLHNAVKMAIFLQYEGEYKAWPENFPEAFDGKGSGEGDLNSWISLLMAMSGDIFGDYEKTQRVDSYTFFTKVNSNIRQAKEVKS